MRVSQLTGRRTNSLGWAKSDCHSCASLGRDCDRRRPRCSPCLAEGTVCSGYVQQLNWERGTDKPGKRRSKGYFHTAVAADQANKAGQAAHLPKPATFTFVDHSETQKRPRRRSRTLSKSSETTASRPESISSELSTSAVSPTSWSLTPPPTPPPPLELTISPSISYNAGSLEHGLSFFHSCFAYTTLTYDVRVNPWRACLPSVQEELPCVRYAAVALAHRQQAHFHGKPEGVSILRLKSQALSLFASQLETLSFEGGLSAALLLIALDYAETGISNWVVHLRGAYRILESHGGIRLAESRPNLRAQIAMLIWYDVTAAMISRRGPVFPRKHLQALMAWQADSEWSVLALNGLPDDMFLDMQELAVAAAESQNVDMARVEAIRSRIMSAEIKSGVNEYQAMMSQAWRNGLLLYCARVFPSSKTVTEVSDESDSDERPAVSETTDSSSDPLSLAMQILRLADAIPSHDHCQKQCLMPIILAACEIPASLQHYRDIAIDYGVRWKQKTGIWIFDSALEFMRGVWDRNDCGFVTEVDDPNNRRWVPWTEIYMPSDGHGFLFG